MKRGSARLSRRPSTVGGFKFGRPLLKWARKVCPEWADRDQRQLVIAAMAVRNGVCPEEILEWLGANYLFAYSFTDAIERIPTGDREIIRREEISRRMERRPPLGGRIVDASEINPVWWAKGSSLSHIIALWLRVDITAEPYTYDRGLLMPLCGWGLRYWHTREKIAGEDLHFHWKRINRVWAHSGKMRDTDRPFLAGDVPESWRPRVEAICGF